MDTLMLQFEAPTEFLLYTILSGDVNVQMIRHTPSSCAKKWNVYHGVKNGNTFDS
mgnify:CR=1 FL=1